jgi:hypothetical protein
LSSLDKIKTIKTGYFFKTQTPLPLIEQLSSLYFAPMLNFCQKRGRRASASIESPPFNPSNNLILLIAK